MNLLKTSLSHGGSFCSSLEEEIAESIIDNSSIAAGNDLETDTPKLSTTEQAAAAQLNEERVSSEQTTQSSDNRECQKINFTIRPRNRAVEFVPEETTEIDRLLEVENETELDELRAMSDSTKSPAREHTVLKSVPADVDRLLEASDSELDLLLADSEPTKSQKLKEMCL